MTDPPATYVEVLYCDLLESQTDLAGLRLDPLWSQSHKSYALNRISEEPAIILLYRLDKIWDLRDHELQMVPVIYPFMWDILQ